jgi:hypothetical protein
LNLKQDAEIYFSILATKNGILYDTKQQQEAITRVSQSSGGPLDPESWREHLRCLTNTAATNALRIAGFRLVHLLMVNEGKWAQFIKAPTEMQSVFRDSTSSENESAFGDPSYNGPLESIERSSVGNMPPWARRMPSLSGQENEPL